MSEELISSYVDRSGIADDTKFMTDQLKTVLDLFDKVGTKKIDIAGSKSIKDVATAAKELKTMLDSLESSKQKFVKTDLESAKASLLEAKAKKELALASKAEAQARKENAAAAILEAKALQGSAKAEKDRADALLKGQVLREKEEKQQIATQKQIDELSNDYLQLSRAYTDAAKKAKNYALVLGESHPITVESVKDAKAMHDVLLRVDQSVGQSQRNVGNYKSAFDGLGVSVTQVARELPSLAISAQQFVLAISNNLPMVADEIKRAKDEIAALKAEGKEAPTLFQRLTAATLSWQVGLSVGIALLTAYSGKIIEWVKGLFDSSAALLKATEVQNEYNAARQKGIENEKQYQGLLNNDAEDSFIKKQKDELALARARGASEKEILQLERDQAAARLERAKINFIPDQEAFGRKFGGSEETLRNIKTDLDKAKAAYQEFLKTGKAFGKEFEKGSEDYQKTDKALKNSFDFQSFLYQEQAAKITEFYDAQRDLRVKDTELAKLEAEQRASFFADELQYRADILKNFSQIEEAEQLTRVNARKQALVNEQAIIKGQYLDELFAAKNNDIKIFEAKREYAFKRKKLAEDYERDILAIRQSSIQRQRELDKQYNEQFLEDQEERLHKQEEQERKAFEIRKNYVEEGRDILLRSLEEERNAKIKSANGERERQEIEEKYNRKRKQVELDANVAIMQSALEAAQAKLKLAELADSGADQEQITKLKAAIAELRKELEKLKGVQVNINIDEADASLERLKKKIQEVGGKIIEGFTAISDLIGTNIAKEKNAVQEQIDDIDRKKEKEIEAVNALTISEQEKADKITIINARASAKKEELERKQRVLDLQRARFEKAKNIAEAVLKTAVAVIEGLLKGGPPLAAVYGAIGAAQIAVAIAQPLPKFKHGRKGGPATLGHVGDGGVSEVIYSPDLKHAVVTPDTDTLAYIPKGYGVAPSVEEFQNMAFKLSHKELPVMPVQQNGNDALIYAMAGSIGRLERAIMNKQETHFHWSNGELQKAIKNGNDWLRYVNGNF